MTVITGTVEDIGMEPLSGVLVATSVEFRTSGDIIIAPESRTYPITDGVVWAELVPGPTRVTVQVGSHARDGWDVVVPGSGSVTLASLIDDVFEWTPEQISRFAQLRDEAVAAAGRAEAAAEDVDSAIAGAADQVVAAVEGDRVAAEQAASDAAGSASAASGSASAAAGSASDAAASAVSASSSAGAAAGSAGDAAGSATAAAGSASNAATSASAAAGSATDADAARAAAVVARTGAETARAGAETARDAADGHADRAELAANEFDLTATATTGAAGSNASVTVTGDGPAYGLSFTVPRGDRGDKGDKGLQGTQEVGWTDDGRPYLLDVAAAEQGDSGWRTIDTKNNSGGNPNRLDIRRFGNRCYARVYGQPGWANAETITFVATPPGFKHELGRFHDNTYGAVSTIVTNIGNGQPTACGHIAYRLWVSQEIQVRITNNGTRYWVAELEWFTTDDWPETLPGTAAA